MGGIQGINIYGARQIAHDRSIRDGQVPHCLVNAKEIRSSFNEGVCPQEVMFRALTRYGQYKYLQLALNRIVPLLRCLHDAKVQ